MATDPRAFQLAKHRQDLAHHGVSAVRTWDELTERERDHSVREAATWLHAAAQAGLVPSADRPTGQHSAVWLDDEGCMWGEYQTAPSSHGDAVLPLVWAAEECSSKRELEDYGVTFRLIGWSH